MIIKMPLLFKKWYALETAVEQLIKTKTTNPITHILNK